MAKGPVPDAKPGQPVPELLPEKLTLPVVREIARGCKACDLYKRGTQTVFGEGPSNADIMMVGEQPGDPAVRAASLALRRLGARRIVELSGGMAEWRRVTATSGTTSASR